MLIGTVGSHLLPVLEGDLVRVKPTPSVETLVSDLAAGACDGVLLGRLEAELEVQFRMVCQRHPMAGVWVVDGAEDSYRLLTGGAAVAYSTGGEGVVRSLTFSSIRRLWISSFAWAVASVVVSAGLPDGMNRYFVCRVFQHALSTTTTRALAAGLDLEVHALQRRLANLQLRGPKRFLMAGRVLQAWEHARLGRESLERIGYGLGYSSLAALGKLVHQVLGLVPSGLASLDDRNLLHGLELTPKVDPLISGLAPVVERSSAPG